MPRIANLYLVALVTLMSSNALALDNFYNRIPYIVDLAVGDEVLCKGALIGPKHVLTAKNCLDDQPLRDLKIYITDKADYTNDESHTGVEYFTPIVPHIDSLAALGVLKLKEPVKKWPVVPTTLAARPLQLGDVIQIPRYSMETQMETDLVTVTVMSGDECDINLIKGTVCGFDPNAEERGYSPMGTPIFYKGELSGMVIVADTSGVGAEGALITNVAEYRDFIVNSLKKLA